MRIRGSPAWRAESQLGGVSAGGSAVQSSVMSPSCVPQKGQWASREGIAAFTVGASWSWYHRAVVLELLSIGLELAITVDEADTGEALSLGALVFRVPLLFST